MRYSARIAVFVVLLVLLSVSCTELFVAHVRFQNNSATKTVRAIWDGMNAATLSPGEVSDYQDANPGNHTIQWKNDNGAVLTSMGYPSLVEGKYYTYPYND